MLLLHMHVTPLLGKNLFQRMFAIIANYVKLSDTFNYHQPTYNIFTIKYLSSFYCRVSGLLNPLNSCNSHRFWKHYIATICTERMISTL